jgi:hypothetical protein
MWGSTAGLAPCAKARTAVRREPSSRSRATASDGAVGRAAPDKLPSDKLRAGTTEPRERGVSGAGRAGKHGAGGAPGAAAGKAGNPASLHGQRITIDAAHGAVSAVEYAPAEGAQLVGCLLLTPGSGGGLGPGVAVHPQPFDDIRKTAAVGAIFTRLGMELSTGRQVRRRGEACEHAATRGGNGAVVLMRGRRRVR